MSFEETGEQSRRWRAFRAALAHSRRVVWFRRLIVAFCLVSAAALTGLSFFNPFSGRGPNVGADSTRLNGSRIIMENPRLSGYRQDGKPYDLRAASGAQDIKTPNIIELTDIDAKMDASGESAVHLTAPAGTYDSSKDTMVLSGDIRITGETRFDIRLREAIINFKAGTIVSDQPLTAAMPSGVIAARRLLVTENGKKIRFYDGVETTLTPAVAPAGDEGRK